MLRPERMSRVSVTGSKPIMDDVVEAVYDLNLVHVTDYDGEWEGFDPGDPVDGADAASDKLVTVRSLQSILGVEDDDAGPARIVTEDALDEELEEVRAEVNELDDRRSELEDDLQAVEERIDAVEPLADVGIDLDLLSGYDNLSVAVGEGDPEAVRRALVDAEGVEAFEIRSGDEAMAVFVYPAVDLEDALVGAEFTAHEVPEDAEGSPEEYVADLRHRRQQLASKLDTVEGRLEEVRLDAAGFLLAAEEKLAIEVQKREAPLSFATTENAFVAEGWIPTDRVTDVKQGIQSAVGDHVEVEELERADFDKHGHAAAHESVDGTAEHGAGEVAADGTGEPREARTDGGATASAETPMSGGDPPVVQDNPGVVRPFELLTNAVGRPNYSEFDPTIVLFLTFPAFFGFMIGDVGYGLVYAAIGYFLYSRFESDAFRNIGLVTVAAGALTALFGVLFGEIFGLHLITQYLWEPLIGHPPLEKGLAPAAVEWAEAWFVITALVGVLHIIVAYAFEFVEGYELHGFREAMVESGSWLFALVGLWLFIFSRLAAGPKPELLFQVFDHGENAAFELGFSGLPVWVGWLGVGLLVVGAVLLALGPTYELIELHTALAHPLSYLRISAELLAEVGLAFAVNLLFFGAYQSEGEFHFMLSHGSEYVLAHHEHATIMFGGLIHGGPLALLLGLVVLVVGHLVVLALGVMSVGIQAIRLEYFEFFSKFYEGNGTPYDPFGYEREFTTDE